MRKIFGYLYFWVLLAIILGALTGGFFPAIGESLKPLGDGFIGLIKMMIAPVIFCTVVLGIAGAGDAKKVGRVGLRAILYFEVVSTLALGIGMLVANVLKPGADFHADPRTLDASAIAEYSRKAQEQSIADFFLHLIPRTFVDAFTNSGDLLQVLLLALLFGFAMNAIGERAKPVLQFIEGLSQILFKMVSLIMRLAPLGAGGAMAFTIGKFGFQSLGPLASLLGSFYLCCGLFLSFVLAPISYFCGFRLDRLLLYIREELLLVLGTSSSESALLPIMNKLERLGCSRSVVGLVVPAGYSFNLDGTNIYLSMAAIFVAQALGVDITLRQQITLMAVAMLTSKGASGVTGAGFITLAATLAAVPTIPVAGLTLILGVDRFLSEARALTNLVGNCVATIVISRWEKELDHNTLRRELEAPARNNLKNSF